MTDISIGQVVYLGERRGVVLKRIKPVKLFSRTTPETLAVVFFDDYDSAFLRAENMSDWTITDEVVSQDVVAELQAGNERMGAEFEAELDRVDRETERLLSLHGVANEPRKRGN